MPKALKDLHPEWITLDTDLVTLVLNNIYAHPSLGPYEEWTVWRSTNNHDPLPTKLVTFFGNETIDQKYVPITDSTEVINHLALKWLAIPGCPTVLFYHPF